MGIVVVHFCMELHKTLMQSFKIDIQFMGFVACSVNFACFCGNFGLCQVHPDEAYNLSVWDTD